MLPMLMAVGVGLTIINTRAVLEALFGVETSFVRTPKFAIGGAPDEAGEQAVPARAAAGCRTWKSRSGRISWA